MPLDRRNDCSWSIDGKGGEKEEEKGEGTKLSAHRGLAKYLLE